MRLATNGKKHFTIVRLFFPPLRRISSDQRVSSLLALGRDLAHKHDAAVADFEVDTGANVVNTRLYDYSMHAMSIWRLMRNRLARI